MRIDEMRGFFSRIAPGSGAAKSNAASSVLPVPLQQQQADDSLLLSNTGKILGLNVKKSPSLTGAQNTETDKLSKLPEWAQQADKILSQTINIFERMKKLAILAQDEKISELERVDMQIEMEGLRANLMAMPRNMRSVVEGEGASLKRLSQKESNPLLDFALQGMEEGYYDYGDYSSVLGRMKTRIVNNEEWDVREAWAPHGFSRFTYDENGEEIEEVFAAEAWYVVGDEKILTRDESGKYVDSGRNIPTVREILERKCPVIVMDAESAANGMKYLEEQIASIEERREYLKANFEEPFMKERTVSFLEKLIFPDEIPDKELLIDPTVASAFLSYDGIYDTPEVLRELDTSEGENEYRDLPFAEEEVDGSAFTNNGEAVKILMSNLNKDPITSNITIEEPKQPNVIEIKGISQKKK